MSNRLRSLITALTGKVTNTVTAMNDWSSNMRSLGSTGLAAIGPDPIEVRRTASAATTAVARAAPPAGMRKAASSRQGITHAWIDADWV